MTGGDDAAIGEKINGFDDAIRAFTDIGVEGAVGRSVWKETGKIPAKKAIGLTEVSADEDAVVGLDFDVGDRTVEIGVETRVERAVGIDFGEVAAG